MIVAVIIFLLAFIIVIPFAVIRKKEHLSGEYGERKTSNILFSLKQEDEEIINNYLASRNRDNTHSIQIDHIYISHKGVFVVETKDYRGRIYGSKEQRNWTQVLAYGNVKNKLYNPIKQNETHCNYVDHLLHNKYPIYSAVVFINADIRRVKDAQGLLFEPYSFKRWYRNIPQNDLMTPQTIQNIKQALLDEMNRRQITSEEHIRNIKRKYE